ncbi:kinase-like domain-containing protein, partial [Thamnocephalis sphaerospora]
GYGSHGTVVFRGSFGGKQVAVKRLLLDFYDLADREVGVLQDSDDHPNVVRYYCQERCDRFLYIALELCRCTLSEAVERSGSDISEPLSALSSAQLLYQIAAGVHHLHQLKLVHRDLKPQNILVANGPGAIGMHEVRVLISDFGLCKRLEVDQSSFGDTAVRHGSGTIGWRAPELLLAADCELQENLSPDASISDSTTSSQGRSSHQSAKDDEKPRMRITRAIDVFATGCIFYYALTGGRHPFGDRYEREANILDGRLDLSALDMKNVAEVEARDLITSMIQHDPAHRPTMAQVLAHPFFWPAAKRLAFLQDASDRLETEPRDVSASPLLTRLEMNSISVVGLDWSKRMDKAMLGHLGKFRKYDVRSVRDLLRAIRNKKHHYQDLPENARRLLGTIPDGFHAYFAGRFPLLLLHVYYVLAGHLDVHVDPLFHAYFDDAPITHVYPDTAH